MFKTATTQAVRVLIAGALMWLAARNVDWGDVAAALGRASRSWLAICLVLVVMDRALMAWRWVALLRAVESPPRVPLRQVVRLFFVSTFVGTFLPGSIGGDAVRAVSLSRLGAPMPVAVGSVAVDRLLGTVSVLVMAVAGVLLAGWRLADKQPLLEDRLLTSAVAVTTVGVAGALLLLFDSRVLAGVVRWAGGGRVPSLERWALRFLSAVRQYGTHHGLLAAVLAVSVAVQALRSAQAWCLGLAIGLTISGDWYFALIPFGVLAFLLPLSISGLGAGTASFVPLFALAGVLETDAMALALLFWFLGILGNFPGGLLMLVSPKSIARPTEPKP